jgi:hypothetical protein
LISHTYYRASCDCELQGVGRAARVSHRRRAPGVRACFVMHACISARGTCRTYVPRPDARDLARLHGRHLRTSAWRSDSDPGRAVAGQQARRANLFQTAELQHASGCRACDARLQYACTPAGPLAGIRSPGEYSIQWDWTGLTGICAFEFVTANI